jgi:hypothetical protein
VADEDDIEAKARKLVEDLEKVTASAEDLANTVAEGIRKERAAGRSLESPASTPTRGTVKAKRKRAKRTVAKPKHQSRKRTRRKTS